MLRCLQLGSFTGLSENPQPDCGWKEQIQRMVGVRGTFEDYLVQGLFKAESARASCSRSCDFVHLELDMSSDGDYITSLDNLFQCCITAEVKVFWWNFLYLNLCPLPLVLSQGTT